MRLYYRGACCINSGKESTRRTSVVLKRKEIHFFFSLKIMIFRNKIKFIVSEAPILYILQETIPPILEETQKTVFLPH